MARGRRICCGGRRLPSSLFILAGRQSRPAPLNMVICSNCRYGFSVGGAHAALLAVYLRRRGIEQVSQRITEVFGLARFIGSSAEATVFQASYCLVLHDVIRVVQRYVAAAGVCMAEEVSTQKLFADVHEELLAACKLVSPAELAQLVDGAGGAAELRERLRGLLQASWRPR
jgi:hypothetical protein